MLTNTSSKFEKALGAFKNWCDMENIDPHTFREKSNQNSEVPRNSQSKIAIGAPKSQILPEGLNKMSEIAIMLENSLETLKKIKKSTQDIDQDTDIEIIDISQTFDQLYNKKSRSAIEQKLIDVVDAHLSETEKNDAISTKKPVSNVIQQVELAFIKLAQQTYLMLRAEKGKEESKEKEQLQPVKDDKMHSLGQEYGVANEIVKSIRERVNELSAQSHLSVRERENESRAADKKPLFEVVDSTKISSNDMKIDKNNVAEKEKKQELQIRG